MRVSREEMNRSHERIVSGAARLFRERGLESSSVADVMESAGLTQGGFYRHFETKNALVSEAIKAAFAQMLDRLAGAIRQRKPKDARDLYRRYYLSEAHLNQPGTACPVATLSGDIARADPALKEHFGNGVRQMVAALEQLQSGSNKSARQDKAIRDFALLVGAAVIARASDPRLAEQVLKACGE